MQTLIRFAGTLARLQLTVAAIAVLAILLTISVDVFLRAAFNAPFSSTIEIVSFYYMIPLVFFPIMTLELSGGHIDTDLFYRLFPRRMQQLSIAVSGMLTIGVYGLLTTVTFKQAIASTKSGEVAMGVNLLPIWPIRWVLPVVFASATLAAALLTIDRIRRGDDDV
jgi:TRAP-type C4-dicarboxylate transport system permease small subunit